MPLQEAQLITQSQPQASSQIVSDSLPEASQLTEPRLRFHSLAIVPEASYLLPPFGFI
jgi:hypothetical protein